MTSYGTPADKIVAYTFRAEILCPTCTIETLITAGMAAPGARGMREEDVLDQIAGEVGIDRRYDEREWDSDDFPKIVFSCQIEHDEDGIAERCDGCGEELV